MTGVSDLLMVIGERRQWAIARGHVLDVLATIPSNSVQCVVTSPPYWGLRAYKTQPIIWGGDPSCDHLLDVETESPMKGGGSALHSTLVGGHQPRIAAEEGSAFVEVVKPAANGIVNSAMQGETLSENSATRSPGVSAYCSKCGAWRGELGSEPTIELFVSHLVEVFAEVRRVLRPDGVCWLNIGDSYAGSGRGPGNKGIGGNQEARQGFANGADHRKGAMASILSDRRPGRGIRTGEGYELREMSEVEGVEEKNLCLIPERLSIALQDSGWWVRSRVAWCKTSSMPESVKDRPTSAWEIVYMLTKGPHYHYDAEAVKTPVSKSSLARVAQNNGHPVLNTDRARDYAGSEQTLDIAAMVDPSGANLRNHWWIPVPVADEAWLLGPDPYRAEFCTNCRTFFERLGGRGVKIEKLEDGSKRIYCPVCGRFDCWLSHFATFPIELPRRCIQASTSEYGCCSTCGAPWERVVEEKFRQTQTGVRSGGPKGGAEESNRSGTKRGVNDSKTLAWRPTCSCEAPDHLGRSVVLDPFSGSGTTVLAATDAGLRGLGIELNNDYAEMSERRLPGLFNA